MVCFTNLLFSALLLSFVLSSFVLVDSLFYSVVLLLMYTTPTIPFFPFIFYFFTIIDSIFPIRLCLILCYVNLLQVTLIYVHLCSAFSPFLFTCPHSLTNPSSVRLSFSPPLIYFTQTHSPLHYPHPTSPSPFKNLPKSTQIYAVLLGLASWSLVRPALAFPLSLAHSSIAADDAPRTPLQRTTTTSPSYLLAVVHDLLLRPDLHGRVLLHFVLVVTEALGDLVVEAVNEVLEGGGERILEVFRRV